MKKHLVGFATLISLASFSQDKQKFLENSSIFGGIGFTGFHKTDFTAFNISSYQKTGLNSANPLNSEGRLLVNYDANSASNFPYAHFGYDLNLFTPIHVQAELSISLNDKTNCTQLLFGGSYEFNRRKKISFSVIGQIGFSTGTVYLGKTDSLAGYRQSFEIDGKTFDINQDVTSEIRGTTYNLSVRPKYKINKRLSGYVEVGFRYSQLSKSVVKIGGQSFTDSPDYFLASGTGDTKMTTLPKLTFQSPLIQVGVLWVLKEFVPRDY